MRPLKGWWTVIAGAGVAVVGTLQAFDWQANFDPSTVGYIGTALGVVMVVLRLFTTTPVGTKDS